MDVLAIMVVLGLGVFAGDLGVVDDAKSAIESTQTVEENSDSTDKRIVPSKELFYRD